MKYPLCCKGKPQLYCLLIDNIVTSFQNKNRLFYIRGRSFGRQDILEASECPPIFGVPPTMVQRIIEGILPTFISAAETTKDNYKAGIIALKNRKFSSLDTLVGITASGQAPYAIVAMEYAMSIHAKVGAISCNEDTKVLDHAPHKIFLNVGSTRMKSGTAQKLVLNMITTAAMIRIGKVYNKLMVDLLPLNAKLVDRAKRLIKVVTGCTMEEASTAYLASNAQVKVAIVMVMLNLDNLQVQTLLEKSNGSINKAIDIDKGVVG